MKRMALLVLLAACSRPGVRAADLEAWRHVPVIELERQPHFSSLPRAVRPLSDGSELWDFANCTTESSAKCTDSTTMPVVGSKETTCSGTEYRDCCHNQFIVRAGFVEEYRPVGNCMTDCFKRPSGVCR